MSENRLNSNGFPAELSPDELVAWALERRKLIASGAVEPPKVNKIIKSGEMLDRPPEGDTQL